MESKRKDFYKKYTNTVRYKYEEEKNNDTETRRSSRKRRAPAVFDNKQSEIMMNRKKVKRILDFSESANKDIITDACSHKEEHTLNISMQSETTNKGKALLEIPSSTYHTLDYHEPVKEGLSYNNISSSSNNNYPLSTIQNPPDYSEHSSLIEIHDLVENHSLPGMLYKSMNSSKQNIQDAERISSSFDVRDAADDHAIDIRDASITDCLLSNICSKSVTGSLSGTCDRDATFVNSTLTDVRDATSDKCMQNVCNQNKDYPLYDDHCVTNKAILIPEVRDDIYDQSLTNMDNATVKEPASAIQNLPSDKPNCEFPCTDINRSNIESWNESENYPLSGDWDCYNEDPVAQKQSRKITKPPKEESVSICVQAEVHNQKTNDNEGKINQMKKKEIRQKEIQVCLDQIRTDYEECEINEITIELEQEENVDEQTKNKKNVKNTTNENKSKVPEKTLEKKLTKEDVYQHIDFLSDDEDFVWSSSSWQGTSDSESDELENGSRNRTKLKRPVRGNKKNKKRTKKLKMKNSTAEEEKTDNVDNNKKKIKRTNKAKERTKLKREGKEYKTKSGKTIQARSLQENPCKPEKCHNECYSISNERRQNIFDHFWNLSTERRRDWLISHSKKTETKRKRTKATVSRRKWSHTYFINDGEGMRQVCLQFILKTLDIQQKFLHYTLMNAESGSSKNDERGKKVPPNKTSAALLESVRSYIQSLPSVPSHYCRKNSKRSYLPQEFKNLSNLYKIYKVTKETEGAEFVGEKVFRNLFLNEFNIAFHVPRKDKCQKCIKYEHSTDDSFKEEKILHLKDKDETYSRFQIHQNIHEQDESILCTTFDLQKVLNTPHGESMLLYYSRKLAVFNLTFYESVTRRGYCYTWSEVEGKRGANEICTILEKYILEVDARGTVKHLLLYSDCCPGQNRNKVVLACINRCLQNSKNISSIQMNYLLPGHTFMPVDSMHSVIEKSVNNTIVWAPSQWPTVFALARKNPGPYEVEVLTHVDFRTWDGIGEKYFKGNLSGKISKIRIATFKQSMPNKMQVKYSMAVDAKPEFISIIDRNESTKKLYKSRLAISIAKYNDLVKLCTNNTIPRMYQEEYKNLPCLNNVRDVLQESDLEDNTESD